MSFRKLCLVATLLALVVVVLGAYTRLNDAGLGCPDWPGCYGQMTPASVTVEHADKQKAWIEMTHRYFAGTLGLLILVIAVVSLVRRHQPGQPRFLPLVLLVTVIFQALLGMWTVTLLLHPLVVMGHLLGGMMTLGLCWWLTLPCTEGGHTGPPLRLAQIALLILILQIALGGWVSANYAALACPDFPTCMGHWWPKMDLMGAFTIGKIGGTNFEGGLLSNEGRIAIQMMHRIGAVVAFVFLGFVALKGLRRASSKSVKITSIIMILLLITQVTLGISTVLFIRPLEIATAHNAVAALLLLTVLRLVHLSQPSEK